MKLEFRDGRVDQGDGAALVDAMRAEMARVYEGLELDGAHMPAAGPAELGAPAGAFIVGYHEGRPVCCGGVKRLAPDTCELKRMYVVPDLRGKGIARVLLGALESRAREMGFTIARLDTGPRQPFAQALYESAGYEPIPNFNANPVASFFGQKRLT